jgi:predicted AAA+ superfamily ATPase
MGLQSYNFRNMLKRRIQKSIQDNLFKGQAIVVYGPRQVGKTTLMKQIIRNNKNKNCLYLNCENFSVQENLKILEAKKIKEYFNNANLVVLDEAQVLKNPGGVIKLMVDTYPKIQILATGSSSFDLENKLGEPLVGRAYYYKLYPLSVEEVLLNKKDLDVEEILKFGLYPEVFFSKNKEEDINNISSGYLLKDILSFEGIKKSDVLIKLLKLLALQIGNEVSFNELARNLSVDKKTVEKYIDILEKCFIIFKVHGLSRNLRKEVSKNVKIYFYDLGIRNSLILNYNEINKRNDAGGLWENFCILERMKYREYNNIKANIYFWRTYTQKEIDYIEEREGKFFAYEIKWGKGKIVNPTEFINAYSNSQFEVINKENYLNFIS